MEKSGISDPKNAGAYFKRQASASQLKLQDWLLICQVMMRPSSPVQHLLLTVASQYDRKLLIAILKWF